MLRADTVVEIAGQHSVFNQIGFLSFRTFIVEVHRPPIERNSTVIYHVDMFAADFLVQLVGKYGNVLPVEIRFKSMSDSLVKQDTRSSGTHNYRHFTSFRFDGLEQKRGLVYRFAGDNVHHFVRQEIEPSAVGTGSIAVLRPSVFFHDAHCPQRHHRTIIVEHHAFRIAEEDMRGGVALACLHFMYPLVQSKYLVIQFLQIRHLILQTHFLPRGSYGIIVLFQYLFGEIQRFIAFVGRSNAGGCAGSFQHILQCNILHVGIAALVSNQHTDSDSIVYIRITVVHRSIHQADTVCNGVFKEKIGVVASFLQCCSEHFFQVCLTHSEMIHSQSNCCLLVSSFAAQCTWGGQSHSRTCRQ